MNKGTAIVGFFISFLAGMFLMWGMDKRAGGDGDISAEGSATTNGAIPDQSAASVPVSSKDPQWGKPFVEGSAVGQAQRTGHDRRDQRLPMSLLQPRRSDAQADQGKVRSGQGPHRLEAQPAAVPQERARRARSRSDRHGAGR
jgi:hypothetical protein